MSRVVYVPRDNTQIETDLGQLEETLAKVLHDGCTEIDMLVWMSRVSLESIGQAGIGIPFDALAETSPPSEYMLASKQLMWALYFFSPWLLDCHAHKQCSPLSFPLQGFMRLIPSIVKIGTPRFRGFLAKIAPHPNIRKLREIIYLLYDTNKSIYRQRVHDITQAEKIGAKNTGRDIVSVLSAYSPSFSGHNVTRSSFVVVRQNRGADSVDKLSDDELISQMG